MEWVKPVSILDDKDLYTNLDSTDLRHRLYTFPLQCLRAWEQAQDFKMPREYQVVDRIVVLGMGGSAIGGDLLAGVASLEESPQIEVNRDYDLPSYVAKDTLVLACSYSGDTAETLSGFRRARSKGAKLVVVTRGGILGQEAKEAAIPLFAIDYEGEPRSALGYSFLVPLGILVNLGLLSDKALDVKEAVESLSQLAERLNHRIPTCENPAKGLALELQDKLSVIYGGGFFQGVARRWKTQLNENSKVWALWDVLPEAHHNSVVGYALPGKVKELALVVLLRPEPLHPGLALRYHVTEELLESQGVAYRSIAGEGYTPLSQILTTVLLGDYTSYYLALLQGVDPSPVPPIDFIKDRLMR